MKTFETKKMLDDWFVIRGWNVVIPFVTKETAEYEAKRIESTTGCLTCVAPSSDKNESFRHQKKIHIVAKISVDGVSFEDIEMYRWVNVESEKVMDELLAFDMLADHLDYIHKDDAVEYVCETAHDNYM